MLFIFTINIFSISYDTYKDATKNPIDDKDRTQDTLRGESRDQMHRGLNTQCSSNNALLLIMVFPALRSWKYLRSRKGGRYCILYPVHSDIYWRDKTGGYVLWTVVQAVAQVQGKDISGYQSCFLSGGGGLSEQAKYHVS